MSITKDMIRRGFDKGIVKIVDSPNGDGAVCKIGYGTLSNWFYFGGLEAEQATAETYVRNVPLEDIINEIYIVLKELDTCWDDIFEDEYKFYEAVLTENECKI